MDKSIIVRLDTEEIELSSDRFIVLEDPPNMPEVTPFTGQTIRLGLLTNRARRAFYQRILASAYYALWRSETQSDTPFNSLEEWLDYVFSYVELSASTESALRRTAFNIQLLSQASDIPQESVKEVADKGIPSLNLQVATPVATNLINEGKLSEASAVLRQASTLPQSDFQTFIQDVRQQHRLPTRAVGPKRFRLVVTNSDGEHDDALVLVQWSGTRRDLYELERRLARVGVYIEGV